ncbi:MAG: YncE family protein, partial [Terracidiphilus sp.]
MNPRIWKALCAAAIFDAGLLAAQAIHLPTSKELMGPVPGHPQRLNSLPISMALSPGGRYLVTVNAGFGTFESNYDQSLAVLDTRTGALTDFPDSRTLIRASQTLFSGLAFSRDGQHLYASMASLTDPTGKGKNATGNGILVYSFKAGKIAPARLIPLPLQRLAPGRETKLIGDREGGLGVPYPAAIAVVGPEGAEKLLVADNLSDDVLLLDVSTGAIEKRFDLSESDAVPSTYPIALTVSRDGRRVFVALWNASQIVELDLVHKTIGRKLDLLKPASPVAPGTHPCAFAFSPDGRTLYVALANRDAVAAVNVGGGQFSVKGYFDTRLPGQSYFGAEPVALAVNRSGSRLYVANMATDSVAVIAPRRLTARAARQAMVEPMGFVPTEWMPISMAFLPSPAGGTLYVATAKGKGTGPNNFAQRIPAALEGKEPPRRSTYIATLLYGSLAAIPAESIEAKLPRWTSVVLASNRMKAAAEKIAFADGRPNPIRHVIYIIKENRTYDQILGDLEENGRPVGNGDPRLTMYGKAITPNQHKLALQ